MTQQYLETARSQLTTAREELETRWPTCGFILPVMIVHCSIKTCVIWRRSWPTFLSHITSIRHYTIFVSVSRDTR